MTRAAAPALAAALLGSVLAAAAPARAECVLNKQLTLPVVMVGPRPSVEARLDGHPVRLEIDSGAFFSTLSSAAVSQLGLHASPAPYNMHVMGVGGEAAKVDVARVRFGLGKAELPQIDFVVVPGLQAEMGIVGLLGRNILAQWDVEYDLSRGEISLLRPRDCGSRPLAYWSQAPDTLSMAPEAGALVRPATVWVKINGVDIKAMLDTGAATSGLTLAGARKARLDVHAPTATPAGFTMGIGRRMARSWLVPVAEIRIGGETIKTTKMRVSDYESAQYDMLIGADFFLSHHVYIANSQQKVYFTYNGGPVFDLSVKPNAAPPVEPAPTVIASAEPGGAGAGAAPAANEPKDADGYSRRGQAYVARGDFAHALPDLSRAVELDPQNPRYLRERAQLRLQTRQPFLAMADLDAVLKLTPDDAEAHLLRARLRATGRDRAGEEADLDAADRASAKEADLKLGLGQAYTSVGRYDRAVADYDQWLAAHDGDARQAVALNGRCWARALANSGLDQALRDCDAALRLQPKQPAFLDSRGLVHLRRGELDRAMADYDAALSAQPKLAWALYGRGVIKTRKGDAAGGQADIAAATTANAQAPELAKRVGLTP